MRGRFALLLLALALPATAHDVTLKPLPAGGYQEMLKARQGQPFMLVLWSVACEPCRAQFPLLSDLAHANPRVPLVIVSTDGPGLEKSALAALERHGLEHEDARIFSGDPAAIRREIDPQWDGKLPRTYLYDASHARQAISGPLDRGRIDGWTRQVTALH